MTTTQPTRAQLAPLWPRHDLSSVSLHYRRRPVKKLAGSLPSRRLRRDFQRSSPSPSLSGLGGLGCHQTTAALVIQIPRFHLRGGSWALCDPLRGGSDRSGLMPWRLGRRWLEPTAKSRLCDPASSMAIWRGSNSSIVYNVGCSAALLTVTVTACLPKPSN